MQTIRHRCRHTKRIVTTIRRTIMSTLSVRLPESLHKKAKELAAQENISVNQFITTALAEKISALITEDYLENRAARGSREKFKKALSKVKAAEPAEEDRL